MENSTLLQISNILKTFLSPDYFNSSPIKDNLKERFDKSVYLISRLLESEQQKTSDPEKYQTLNSALFILKFIEKGLDKPNQTKTDTFYSNFDNFYNQHEQMLFSWSKSSIDNTQENILIHNFAKNFISSEGSLSALEIFSLISQEDPFIKQITTLLTTLREHVIDEQAQSYYFEKWQKLLIQIPTCSQILSDLTDRNLSLSPNLKNNEIYFCAQNLIFQQLKNEEIFSLQKTFSTFGLEWINKIIDLSFPFQERELLSSGKLSDIPDFMFSRSNQEFSTNIKIDSIGNVNWIIALQQLSQASQNHNTKWSLLWEFFGSENKEILQFCQNDMEQLYFFVRTFLNDLLFRKYILLRKILKEQYVPFTEDIRIEKEFELQCRNIHKSIFGVKLGLDETIALQNEFLLFIQQKIDKNLLKNSNLLNFVPAFMKSTHINFSNENFTPKFDIQKSNCKELEKTLFFVINSVLHFKYQSCFLIDETAFSEFVDLLICESEDFETIMFFIQKITNEHFFKKSIVKMINLHLKPRNVEHWKSLVFQRVSFDDQLKIFTWLDEEIQNEIDKDKKITKLYAMIEFISNDNQICCTVMRVFDICLTLLLETHNKRFCQFYNDSLVKLCEVRLRENIESIDNEENFRIHIYKEFYDELSDAMSAYMDLTNRVKKIISESQTGKLIKTAKFEVSSKAKNDSYL